MATDFPNNPSHGDVFGTFIYDGTVPGWRSNPETASGMPAGSIMAWGSDVAPTNWLICNGSAVSRTTYASLFAAIGVTYGVGDGATTFNLPDLRGKVPVGKDSTQTEFDLLGETGGNKATAKYGDGTTTGYGATYSSSLGAGDTTASNLQPYQVVNYIIKASAGTSAGDSELATRVGATETVNATQNTRLTNLEYYSPNYLINGAFEINQRGFSSTTSSGFTFDRWSVASSSGTVTCSNQTFSPGASPSAAVTGKNYLRCVTSGQTGTSAYAIFAQAIEGVETLAGETVTVSFWAKAASGTPKIALEMYRSYGAGGTPSADEQLYAGQVTISTSMQRYSITYTLPNISGKTLGTTHTGYLKPQFWVSAGTDFNSRTGSIGIQSNTFDIWGVQVERGSTATSFRRNAPSIQGELAACQRYYYRVSGDASGGNAKQIGMGWTYSTTAAVCNMNLPVTMRTRPTTLDYSGAFRLNRADGQYEITSPALVNNVTQENLAHISFTVTAGPAAGYVGRVILQSATDYLGVSAEL